MLFKKHQYVSLEELDKRAAAQEDPRGFLNNYHELDIIMEKNWQTPIPLEIKAGATITNSFFVGLRDWNHITKQTDSPAYLVYGGIDSSKQKRVMVYGWQSIHELMDHCLKKE